MEIKYEAVFGDQAMFDRNDAPDDCEIIGDCCYKVTNGDVKVWNFSEKKWCKHYKKSFLCLAMRRIIRTPTWTVADQKAGKLPGVGAKFLYMGEELCCHYVDSNGEVWANNFKGEVVTPLLREIQPIETPEEKVKRLREEWCSNALDSASILSGMREYEMKRLGDYIGNIYDALLSGDLPVPVKE